jgi:hypothetical protein
VEILAAQFMTPTPISAALAEIRQRLGREHQAILSRRQLADYHELMMILMAAASYLAMRAVKSPRYMGDDISAGETWARLMRAIEAIIDRALTQKETQ